MTKQPPFQITKFNTIMYNVMYKFKPSINISFVHCFFSLSERVELIMQVIDDHNKCILLLVLTLGFTAILLSSYWNYNCTSHFYNVCMVHVVMARMVQLSVSECLSQHN